MEALKALNWILLVIIALVAMLTAFLLPAEIPAALLALSYPSLTYHIFNASGDDDGDYGSVLGFVLLVLTWIIVVFAVIYWRYGLVSSATGQLAPITFPTACYFSVTTWTTLGYGDFAPPPRIRHITSIQALLGFIGMGIWMATLSHWIAFRTEQRRTIRERNAALGGSVRITTSTEEDEATSD